MKRNYKGTGTGMTDTGPSLRQRATNWHVMLGRVACAIVMALTMSFVAATPATINDALVASEALAAEATPHVKYAGHVQRIGWQDYVRDGATAGTSGRSLRVEALHVYLENAGAGSYVDTRAHVQQIGWTNWQPGYCGTSGRGLRVEAIQLKLQGPIAKTYDIKYRVHVQGIGWMKWVKNGAVAGTSGRSLRIEAIQIKLTSPSSGPSRRRTPTVTRCRWPPTRRSRTSSTPTR